MAGLDPRALCAWTIPVPLARACPGYPRLLGCPPDRIRRIGWPGQTRPRGFGTGDGALGTPRQARPPLAHRSRFMLPILMCGALAACAPQYFAPPAGDLRSARL